MNEVTPHLFLKAKTPEAMIQLSIEEIANIIRPCGLSNNKAKAIWNLSKILIEKHNGKVPASFEELEALPGVGHKTASCIMSQSFHIPAFPVDTHIHRLAKRFGISEAKSVTQTEHDLKAFFPKSHWNKLHLQLIYYARAYCPARNHKIELCPICSQLQ